MKRIIFLLVCALMLAACTKEEQGMVLGAAVGGILGNQIGGGSGRVIATAVGVAAGAAIGGKIGRQLDEKDRLQMQMAYQQSLEYNRSGQATTWNNPDSGNYGSFTPERTTQNAHGQYCREYQQTVVVAGEEQQAYGRACRQRDGTWQIMNS